MKKLKLIHLITVAVISLQFIFISCNSIDLYERTVSIPGHAWNNSYKPSFTFNIKDTLSSYQLYLVLRHSDKYSFNNIYINLQTLQPGQDSAYSGQYDLRLATDNDGWLGTGMDDIFEHNIPLTPTGEQFYFKKPGNYTFTIEQIMRENPLKNVMNVGLRIEKKQ